MDKIKIDIAVCTFKRAHIVDTLNSLASIDVMPNWDISIIVADNDDTPSAREMVATLKLPFPIKYVHAPARNISVARNACLDNANADYLVFIDDDELVSKEWLVELIKETLKQNSTVTLGRVNAVYSPNCPNWIIDGDFHSTKPVFVNGRIITGYSSNTLLNLHAIELKNLRFRDELGRTGGEDSVFIATIFNRGGHIAYAPNAVIYEPVPLSRASFSWLMKRRFRAGQTHGLMLLEKNKNNKMKNIALATAKAAFCFAMAIPNIFVTHKIAAWILRGVMHCGVVAKLMGKAELVQYGH